MPERRDTMISVDDALRSILDRLHPVGEEIVSIADALDRRLAADYASRRAQPAMDVSSMDGYAVRAADLAVVPARLNCVASVPAGSGLSPTIPPGACARIFTGAAMPPGTDTVVIQENTEVDATGRIIVTEPIAAQGQWVRRAGLDFDDGDMLLRLGTTLGPAEIGLAAAMNHPWLRVYRRPRVAILATGDEIALPGDPLSAISLPSSNSFQLMAMVRRAGGEPVHCGIVPDDPDQVRRRVFQAAATADLVVSSGGASVGDHDHIQRLFGGPPDEGCPTSGQGTARTERHFWKIAMRPGKPLLFGTLADTPMLGLPGNPVSCFVCGLIFMTPAIRRLTGATTDAIEKESDDRSVLARVTHKLEANDHRQDYLRARLQRDSEGGWEVHAFEKQDSSMMSVLAKSNGLIVRPPHAAATKSGEFVSVIKL
ncbi:gephyrin-like molybdotransferase Glp [Fodinicurvata sp. EGI_FJ10296]|uniref:molybdopterin molybdotransferase MoeA n=1 Tax=Fodinicurvata sp. EGI_FJ10296 TaxID=3231908 RepID=UPI0034538D40